MPYVIPSAPPMPGWGDYAGQGIEKVTDMLLQAILSGQLGARPTGGTYQAPTGATTAISPAERVAPGQAGAGQSLASLLQQGSPGSFRGTGFGGFQVQPNLTRQSQEADIAYKQSQADWYKRLPGMLGTMNPITGQPEAQSASAPTSAPTSSIYQVGDILERNGKRARISGFDPDGTPLMEPF